jgi:hypothetical protein
MYGASSMPDELSNVMNPPRGVTENCCVAHWALTVIGSASAEVTSSAVRMRIK